MQVYFDTEFTELHQNTTLVSIGLIADTGQAFYAEFTDYDRFQVTDWLQENVIDKLILSELGDNSIRYVSDSYPCGYQVRGEREFITEKLTDWLNSLSEGKSDGDIQMWSDCYAYDWMLFCQLWGHAFNVPSCIYYIPFDLSTFLYSRNQNPDVNREEFAFGETGIPDGMTEQKHNALWDAIVIKACVQRLISSRIN